MPKRECMGQLYNFKIGGGSDPVDELFDMEDLHVKLNNAGISVNSDTLYACFVSALLPSTRSRFGT